MTWNNQKIGETYSELNLVLRDLRIEDRSISPKEAIHNLGQALVVVASLIDRLDESVQMDIMKHYSKYHKLMENV